LPASFPIPSIHERIQADAAAAELSMQFRGGTAAECRQWQGAFRSKLLALLQHPQPPTRWRVVREAEAMCHDHTAAVVDQA
jgi:hypothetical protein